MSTEAAEPATTQKGVWRLETPNGSMAPRSALDVLVDLNDRVTSGKVGEFQPIPLGFTPLEDCQDVTIANVGHRRLRRRVNCGEAIEAL